MAWTSAHFAVGMACSGAAAAGVCCIVRRGWRWIPAVMTVGGLWALIPDLPRLWRVDFPWLPGSGILGSLNLEHRLHNIGDVFFFHKSMDAPPHLLYALHGLIAVIFLYNTSIVMLMWMEHRQRNSLGNRYWRAHAAHLRHRYARTPPPAAGATRPLDSGLMAAGRSPGRAIGFSASTSTDAELAALAGLSSEVVAPGAASLGTTHATGHADAARESRDPVLHRIRSSHYSRGV
jgi:hypothetical protein